MCAPAWGPCKVCFPPVLQEPMDLMELLMARCCSPQNSTPPTLRMRVPGPLFVVAPQSGLFSVPAHQQRDHQATTYTLELQLRGFQALRSDVHAVQRDSAKPSLRGPGHSWSSLPGIVLSWAAETFRIRDCNLSGGILCSPAHPKTSSQGMMQPIPTKGRRAKVPPTNACFFWKAVAQRADPDAKLHHPL